MTTVIIIAKDGWMGHPKGSRVDVNDPKASDLVYRKVAEKKASKEAKPSKDKMVKSSKTK